MLDHFSQIYSEMRPMMKHLKKKPYETRMASFREQYGHYFTEMITYVEQSQNPAQAELDIAEQIVSQVRSAYEQKGKIKSAVQADLNMFTVYYVFPALLLTGQDCAEDLCKAICDTWGKTFKDSKIGYTTYEELHGTFNEKIFGFF